VPILMRHQTSDMSNYVSLIRFMRVVWAVCPWVPTPQCQIAPKKRCQIADNLTVKDPERFVFDVDAVRVESRRQGLGDRRANPAGKVPDDVWTISRVAGTFGERIAGFPTQLPVKLASRVVACASEPDDLVVDPFSGSGTTGRACIGLGQRFVGIELSEGFAERSRRLLASVTPQLAGLA
jgi:DNA methylase